MPYIAYKISYVIGSVIIACGAVCIALYIMFVVLRPKLKHTWFSKLLVAAILAVAVCAMHFCGGFYFSEIYVFRCLRDVYRFCRNDGHHLLLA